MTARPVRHNAQVLDRNGKIFYTSITSLSHISKQRGEETLPGSAHSPEAQFISHKTIDKCWRMLYTVNEDADILSHNLHKSTKSIAV